MQILLTLQPENELIIPFNYNHQLQSALYAKLREGGGAHIHDEGYGEDRDFKAFVFGALQGEHRKEDKHFRFTGTVGKRINISASPEPSIWKYVLLSSSFATFSSAGLR